MIEKMRSFLMTFPGWEEKSICVDETQYAPGELGLFPEGTEQLSVRKDIMGNMLVSCRAVFTLRLYAVGEKAGAACVSELQRWVQTQSAAGLAPVFGDAPEAESLRAEKGSLSRREAMGGLYSIRLTAEFLKKYEVNDYGEN